MTTTSARAGFTLIELMVVIAVIGVLGATLVPSVSNLSDQAKVSRTIAELHSIANAMNAYRTDVGLYPHSATGSWGSEVGLVWRGNASGSHQSVWNGPYLKDWPTRTAWGGIVGCGATGAYYIHPPIGWIDKAGDGADDRYIHMNPSCVYYPRVMAVKIDRAMDDGNPGSGDMRLTGPWPEYIYYYVGEGSGP